MMGKVATNKDDLSKPTDYQQELPHVANPSRWNIEIDGGDLLICKGNHGKNEPCRYERYTPLDKC